MAGTDEQRKWSSTLMFLAAAVGSAVGISNVWKFTYGAGAKSWPDDGFANRFPWPHGNHRGCRDTKRARRFYLFPIFHNSIQKQSCWPSHWYWLSTCSSRDSEISAAPSAAMIRVPVEAA